MDGAQEERVYSVSEANRMADGILRDLVVWVEGEVSGYKGYPNFAFLSLKDEDAVLSCFMPGRVMEEADFKLRDGVSVLARGRLGVYVPGGRFQLTIYEVQEAGEGRLRREFLRLMRELSRQGLFDDAAKKPLPLYPDRVGLITSLEGAAIRDVITNLTRRFPGSKTVVRGVRVQGEGAVRDIVEALEIFNRACRVDVIILARGGGSQEDLQPFNTEEVVRAIRVSGIPVVTGIGHEPDITLADLAADRRASTPTGAAEAVVPSRAEVLEQLAKTAASLRSHVRRGMRGHEMRLVAVEGRRIFGDPTLVIGRDLQRLAETEARIIAAARSFPALMGRRLDALASSISRYPREYRDLPRRIEASAARLRSAAVTWRRLKEGELSLREAKARPAMAALLSREDARLNAAASRLEALSPLAVLARGYAIASRAGETKPLTDSRDVEVGDDVDVRLHLGRLRCEVKGRTGQAGPLTGQG